MKPARSPLRRFWASVVCAISVVLVAACTTDDAKGPTATPDAGAEVSCAAFVEALTRCNLLTGTRFTRCSDDDPKLACMTACVEKASCKQIADAYCEHVINSFGGCLNERSLDAPLPMFTCGDGSSIDVRWHCDGTEDCPDGSDEDCPPGTFECTNGVSIPAGWRCDGNVDCLTSDDERDCGPEIPCGDGTSVGSSRECDGKEDCPGGEDELDCTQLTCP